MVSCTQVCRLVTDGELGLEVPCVLVEIQGLAAVAIGCRSCRL